MGSELDEMISEISVKNRVVLSKEDPLMIFYTMYERFIQNTQTSMDQAYTKHLAELEDIFARLDAENAEKAKKLLTATVNAHKQVMDECGKIYTKSIAEQLQAGISPILSSCGSALQKTSSIAWINLTASVITFLAGCILIIAVLR